jgi:hypothetical protein
MTDSPTEDFTPVSPTEDKTRKVESKLVVATTLATVLYAVLEIIQANTALLAFMPPWLQEVFQAIVPTLLAFLAGYRVPSNRI